MLGDCIQFVGGGGWTGNDLKTLLTMNIRCKLFFNQANGLFYIMK